VAAGILRACDGVKILATSREHLSVTGEALYRMPSLAVPEPGNGLTAEAALQFGAVALFVARAIAANARFAFSDDRAPIVAEICRRLDGIPLAIELAAARSRVLAPKQLLEKLNERFRLLTGGDRTALPRQQTMRAAIDWSYDLLGPDERSVFRTLSIFAGSFALETVAAVYAGNELDEFDVFAIVASLADKSLIHADPSDDGLVRYRLLESTRQYGAEALIESGERDDVATKHAEAYALVAEAIVDDYDTSVHGMWLARVEAELENIRAALGWASNPMVEPSVILRLATSLHRTMALFNAREAQRWVASALERCDEATDPGVVGRLELAQAFLSNVSNQFSAVHLHATNALAHFDDVENARQKADAQRLAGRSLVYLGQAAEGETFLETALASHRRLGSRGTGAALRDLGLARAAAGDLERARQLLAESLRDFEHREDLTNVAQTVGTLAGIEFQAGNIGVALDHAGFALEVLRKLKRRLSIAWILGEMATFSIELEAFDEARVRAGESLAMAREIPSAFFIAHALRQLATVAVLGSSAGAATRAAQLERAAHVLGFVAGRLAELGTTLEPAEAKQNDRARSRLGDELGPDALVRSEIEGSHFTEDRAIATALALFA
jgi:predicted ATPase